MGFHSTKEGFKERELCMRKTWYTSVSIPPRKVSREEIYMTIFFPLLCFHSTKEGFKGRSAGAISSRRRTVSIPPRKVSRLKHRGILIMKTICFHSTKEGFKVVGCTLDQPIGTGFHSTKEGFKVTCVLGSSRISDMFPFHQGRFQGRE